MDNVPKRMLFVNGLPIDKGGIEKAIMDTYKGIDKGKLLIDFVVRKPGSGYFHEEIKGYGGRIFNLFENTTHKGNKKWNFYMDLYSIFSFYKLLKNEGPFCAVHIAHPMLDGFLIIAAKAAGVPVRIAHSNNTGLDDKVRPSFTRILTRKLRLFVSIMYATHLWGCSKAACKYQFGKEIFSDNRAEVVPYPVILDDFISKPCDREEACRKLNISAKKTNYINVGRYAPQKNQLFLLDFFSVMLKKKSNIHLLLTGPGPLEDTIREHIKELSIEDSVTMLDSNTYIPLALTASDFFLLPSAYEGFGIVLIEAQAAGIPCFASDVCQPEPDMGLIDYIPLEKGIEYWADFILNKTGAPHENALHNDRLMEYDILNVTPRMQEVYLEGVRYKNTASH